MNTHFIKSNIYEALYPPEMGGSESQKSNRSSTLSTWKNLPIRTKLDITSFNQLTFHPNQALLFLIGRGGSVADRLMDPPSETTYARLGIGVGEFPDPSPIIACDSTRTIISRQI